MSIVIDTWIRIETEIFFIFYFVSVPSISSSNLLKFVSVEFLLNFFPQTRANLRRSANVAAAASSCLRVLKNQFFLSRLCAC